MNTINNIGILYMNTNSKKTRKRAPMPKPKARAAPTKSRVQPAVSRKNRAVPKPGPKPGPKPAPKPVPRQKQRPKPIQATIAENASLKEWLSVQREKEQKTINAQAALAKEVQNRYQAQVNAGLRHYAAQSMLAYRIQQDPRQRKANEVMREEDPGHVDTIYTEEDLNDIEEMFGPFTQGTDTQGTGTQGTDTVNPIQIQQLRERIRERMIQNKPKKRRGTFKTRKHAGQGSAF